MRDYQYASQPFVVGASAAADFPAHTVVEETLTEVVTNDWINDEYKHLVVTASPKALAVQPGQFFHVLCPSPDQGDLWFRRPQSIYAIDKEARRLEFLYKRVGRGTHGLATLEPGDKCNIVGPLGVGFSLEPEWKNIVVLGRGVGLATMAPISQLAGERGVGVTAILSARNPSYLLSRDRFEAIGAAIVPVMDSDGTSDVDNVEGILRALIDDGKADAFFTCGSNRLFQVMRRLGKQFGIPGQIAMEQVMACGLGPCYVCVKTFEVDGEKVLRRVCVEGPVFDMQETLGW
ncbi:MAG: dihydroorotate dehydrogenase electron transfer subunit [Alphaproteobacteria bacterium]